MSTLVTGRPSKQRKLHDGTIAKSSDPGIQGLQGNIIMQFHSSTGEQTGTVGCGLGLAASYGPASAEKSA